MENMQEPSDIHFEEIMSDVTEIQAILNNISVGQSIDVNEIYEKLEELSYLQREERIEYVTSKLLYKLGVITETTSEQKGEISSFISHQGERDSQSTFRDSVCFVQNSDINNDLETLTDETKLGYTTAQLQFEENCACLDTLNSIVNRIDTAEKSLNVNTHSENDYILHTEKSFIQPSMLYNSAGKSDKTLNNVHFVQSYSDFECSNEDQAYVNSCDSEVKVAENSANVALDRDNETMEGDKTSYHTQYEAIECPSNTLLLDTGCNDSAKKPLRKEIIDEAKFISEMFPYFEFEQILEYLDVNKDVENRVEIVSEQLLQMQESMIRENTEQSQQTEISQVSKQSTNTDTQTVLTRENNPTDITETCSRKRQDINRSVETCDFSTLHKFSSEESEKLQDKCESGFNCQSVTSNELQKINVQIPHLNTNADGFTGVSNFLKDQEVYSAGFSDVLEENVKRDSTNPESAERKFSCEKDSAVRSSNISNQLQENLELSASKEESDKQDHAVEVDNLSEIHKEDLIDLKNSAEASEFIYENSENGTLPSEINEQDHVLEVENLTEIHEENLLNLHSAEGNEFIYNEKENLSENRSLMSESNVHDHVLEVENLSEIHEENLLDLHSANESIYNEKENLSENNENRSFMSEINLQDHVLEVENLTEIHQENFLDLHSAEANESIYNEKENLSENNENRSLMSEINVQDHVLEVENLTEIHQENLLDLHSAEANKSIYNEKENLSENKETRSLMSEINVQDHVLEVENLTEFHREDLLDQHSAEVNEFIYNEEEHVSENSSLLSEINIQDPLVVDSSVDQHILKSGELANTGDDILYDLRSLFTNCCDLSLPEGAVKTVNSSEMDHIELLDITKGLNDHVTCHGSNNIPSGLVQPAASGPNTSQGCRRKEITYEEFISSLPHVDHVFLEETWKAIGNNYFALRKFIDEQLEETANSDSPYDLLMSLFPQADLYYLQEMSKVIGKDQVALSTFIEDQLYENKTDSQYDMLLSMFPDADAAYLQKKSIEIGNDEAAMKNFIVEMIKMNECDDGYQTLLAMFPDSDPAFLQQTYERIGNDSEAMKEFISEQLERVESVKFPSLLAVLPDADPEYLQDMYNKLQGNEESIKIFLMEALEDKDYPTREAYQKRQEIAALKRKFREEFNIEEYLDTIPDPWEHFQKNNKGNNIETVRKLSLFYLERRYTDIPHDGLESYLKKNQYNLTLTCKELDNYHSPEQPADFFLPDAISDTEDLLVAFLQEVAFIENEHKMKEFIAMKKRQKMEAFELAKANGELLECQCCYDNELLDQDVSTCNEGHIFCKECIKKSAEVAIGSGATSFPCLTNCTSEFHLRVIQSVLNPTAFSRMLQRKQLEEVQAAGLKDLESCPFCDFATIPPPGDKVFMCLNPDCMRDSCRKCRKACHIPLRCDELETKELQMRTYIEDRMTDALVRTCWSCNKKFIKESGCNKMICNCGAAMCYICRQPVTNYNHFNGDGGTEFDKCPLHSDIRVIHDVAVQEEGIRAKKEVQELNPSIELKSDPTEVITFKND